MQKKLFANNNPELLGHAKKMRREMTAAEQRLWHFLRAGRLQGYKFRRQQPIGRYIADFVCLAVHPPLAPPLKGGGCRSAMRIVSSVFSMLFKTSSFVNLMTLKPFSLR